MNEQIKVDFDKIVKNSGFSEIDIEEHNISREKMAAVSKGPTVPQIIVNDEPIGGFVDLVKYFEQQGI